MKLWYTKYKLLDIVDENLIDSVLPDTIVLLAVIGSLLAQ